MKKISVLFLLLCLLFVACKNKAKERKRLRDSTINAQTSYNNLFLDSVQLEHFIAQQDSLQKYRDQFFDFYTQRNYEFAWFDANGLTEQAHNFYNLQSSQINNLSDSTLLNPQLQQLYDWLLKNNNPKVAGYAGVSKRAEIVLTGQFFKYAAKVYHGSDIDMTKLGWFIPRKKLNITDLLDSVVDGNPQKLREYEPLSKQYRLLESYASKYYQLKKKNRWDSIPSDKILKLRDTSNTLIDIKKRLFLLGDLKAANASPIFDTLLQQAVINYQKRVGITSNGLVDKRTFKELNHPLEVLVQKILINMERARWMPPDSAAVDKIVINIPDYKLNVYDAGKLSFDMKVVVGSVVNYTTIFNDNIRYVVFSPYWNVPPSITEKELLPAMARNRHYLQSHNMEIVKYEGKIPEIRQKPGVNNPLGQVKFLFPNKYNIYLHDTPFKDAFTSSTKSFSHGCIRIADPKKLAQFLLRRQPAYTLDSINVLMNQKTEKWVDIKPAVQVVIKYFTAWVEADGQLNFRDDIYGHDAQMGDKLFATIAH